MKLFKLYFLLGCSFLININQATAQCSITNLKVTSVNCTPNGTNQDITYCGSFTATNASGDYDFYVAAQFSTEFTESVTGLQKDSTINFCITIKNVPYIPEHFGVAETGSMSCQMSLPMGLPIPCKPK